MIDGLLPIQIPRLRGEMIPTKFCFDDCIATYANYINSNYEMMYIDNWYLTWNLSESLSCLENLKLLDNKLENKLNNLYKYYGIKIKFFNDAFYTADKEINKALQQGEVIILFIDTFYCPWDPGYHNHHTENHSLFIVGREQKSNSLICTDPYFKKMNEIISFDDFKAGYKFYAKIEGEKTSPIFDEINLVAEKLKSHLMEDYFEIFPYIIKELSDPVILQSIIFDDKNNIKIHLPNIILDIADNRTCFLILLNHIASKNENIKDDISKFAKEILYLVEQWNVCRSIAMKGMFKQDTKYISHKLPNCLLNVVKRERECIEGILNILERKKGTISNNKKVKEESNTISSMQNANKKFYYIQLDKYFNNEGIGDIDSKTADFTSMNEYILSNDSLKNGLIETLDMKFRLSKKDGKKDNISCNSEKIYINANYYNEIMFLGCCEWGSFSDNIIVCYEDQSQDVYTLSFLDFVTQTTVGDSNNTACNYKTIKRINGKNEYSDAEHHLYAKLFKVNSMKKIIEIILPMCPNIHVFAISLVQFEQMK